jgi:hypothetical protein
MILTSGVVAVLASATLLAVLAGCTPSDVDNRRRDPLLVRRRRRSAGGLRDGWYKHRSVPMGADRQPAWTTKTRNTLSSLLVPTFAAINGGN